MKYVLHPGKETIARVSQRFRVNRPIMQNNDSSNQPMRLICDRKTHTIRLVAPQAVIDTMSSIWVMIHLNGQVAYRERWCTSETRDGEPCLVSQWSDLVDRADGLADAKRVSITTFLTNGPKGPILARSKLVYLSTHIWPVNSEAKRATSVGHMLSSPGEGNQRLVTSILSTPREVHDWKFLATASTVDCIHTWVVRFCRKSCVPTENISSHGTIAASLLRNTRPSATVQWTSSSHPITPSESLKRQRDSIEPHGTTSTKFILSDESTQCYTAFSVFVPRNARVQVGCRVGRGGQVDLLPRYTIHKSVLCAPGCALPCLTLPPPVTSTQPRRLALLVGVSKYRRTSVNPLEYCDEDVTSWHQYLAQRNFECLILGDEYSPYPRWDGAATVKNVRHCLQSMVAQTSGTEDRLVFVVSGHGSGDGKGSSHLCLLADPECDTDDERGGRYTDTHIQSDLRGYSGKAFVFLDACFSGGIIEELLGVLPNAVGCTTCTENGYGYDSAQEQHGAWTNQFLCKGLCTLRQSAENTTDLMQMFLQSQYQYSQKYRNPGDKPCFFAVDKTRGVSFNSKTSSTAPPLNAFMVDNYL